MIKTALNGVVNFSSFLASLYIVYNGGFTDMLANRTVHCARWAYVNSGEDKFKFKHLLDGIAVGSRMETVAWSRTIWNDRFETLMNYKQGVAKYDDTTYGGESRLSIILELSQNFIPPYRAHDPVNYPMLQSRFIRHRQVVPYSNNLSWFPGPVSVLKAIWNAEENSYDMYVTEKQYVIIGCKERKLGVQNQLRPIHFDCDVMSRPQESTVWELVNLNNHQKLQERYVWAFFFGNWLEKSVCRVPATPPIYDF